VIKKFKTNYLNGLPITVYGNGKKKRDYTHVDDVVQGMLQLLVEDSLSKEVHLGKGSPKSVMAIATAFDTTVIHEFDVPGEPDIVECTTPYIECPNDVIKYINSWLKENPIDN
jgi:nucleoside-diphosphate-sugar epimerase